MLPVASLRSPGLEAAASYWTIELAVSDINVTRIRIFLHEINPTGQSDDSIAGIPMVKC